LPSRPLDSEERLTLLELVDKKKSSGTFRILLGIDREAFTINRAIIYDALGNYNRFDLTNIQFLKAIPASQFEPASPGDGHAGATQSPSR
jgi:outer membrane lipoprotein-sorting protein